MQFAVEAWDPEAPGPMQPIPFSHKHHAGEFQIECLYCHAGTGESQAAGVPSVELCMGCHSQFPAEYDEIEGLVSSLLALIGVKSDPLSGRERILLANIVDHYWSRDQALSIEPLIENVRWPEHGDQLWSRSWPRGSSATSVSSPVATSQIRSTPSLSPNAIRSPSGDQRGS